MLPDGIETVIYSFTDSLIELLLAVGFLFGGLCSSLVFFIVDLLFCRLDYRKGKNNGSDEQA